MNPIDRDASAIRTLQRRVADLELDLEAALAWRDKRAEEISLDLAALAEERGVLRSKLKAIREIAVEAVNEHESETVRLEMIVKLCDRATSDSTQQGADDIYTRNPLGPD